MKTIFTAMRKVYTGPFYWALSIGSSAVLLAVYYLILLQSTTLLSFWQSNSLLYNISAVVLTVLIAALFGISVSLLTYLVRKKLSSKMQAFSGGFLGGALGALSTGCPVCGAWLVSFLGIGGGLAAFPFQGLEIKSFSLLFLGCSVDTSSKAVSEEGNNSYPPPPNPWKKAFFYLAIASVLLLIFVVFPAMSNTNFSASSLFTRTKAPEKTLASVNNVLSNNAINVDEVLPPEGFTINAVYGDIGPKLLQSGVIDLEKFKRVYKRSGKPLTSQQLKILTEGSNEKITINKDNAYFLLNFLWALGLANANPILGEGPLSQYAGLAGIGSFASTGGWTLSKTKATDYFSKFNIVSLNAAQQKELEDFAYNSYRPCCNNSTAFADCNHGMAALGLGEIMAAAGASADEIFQAHKYFNAFWFPQQYIDLAVYFKIKEGKNWKEVDGRTVMGKDYSTASGWSKVRRWLTQNNLNTKKQQGGGGCGV